MYHHFGILDNASATQLMNNSSDDYKGIQSRDQNFCWILELRKSPISTEEFFHNSPSPNSSLSSAQ